MKRQPKRWRLLANLFIFCLSHFSATATYASLVDTEFSEASAAKFEAKDIFHLEFADDPQVAPNGKRIAYVRRSNDIMTDSTRSSIWLVDTDGQQHLPLLSSQHNFYSPRWSPDGSRIAYVSNKTGKNQIFVHWLESRTTALVSNISSSPSSLTWSPDGKHLAFTMSVDSNEKPFSVNMPQKPEGASWAESFTYVTKARYQADGRGLLDPAYTHIFVVSSEGGSAKKLTNGPFHHRGPLSFSADGQSIYFSANRSENWEYEPGESDIHSVDMSGNITRITQAPGAETTPVVSPNGKLIAYSKRDDQKLAYRNRYLHVMNIDGSNDRNLTVDIDNSVSNFHWKSNSGLYFQQMVRGITQIDYVSLSEKLSSIASGLSGTTIGRPYTSGTFDAQSGVVAYTKGRTDRPADIFVKSGRKERQLTQLNEDILGHKKLGEVKDFTYSSSIDGEEIHGWYILPPNYDPTKKYPMIMEIHGGPHLAYGPVFTAELQRMAAEGYVVFYNNHRGSTGYGERFALLLQNKYSSKYDFADHMSGIDWLIEKEIVDEEQLYITGGSAGGIATAYAIGLTDRFRAAVVAKPVINWLSKVLTADSGLYQIPYQFPGMPWDEFEHYWKRSPLSLVGNVTTPTMLITGVEDKRTPMSETEQFYQALKLQKVDTVMVKVPDAAHGIAGRPSRMIGKIENILAWFNKYQSSDVSTTSHGDSKDSLLSLDPKKTAAEYIACLDSRNVTLVSAHRGGFTSGYPENALESMQAAVSHGPMLLEIDIRETQDGELVLMHDRTLDRGTNGTGKLTDFTLEELSKLKLKDTEGTLTSFSISTLEDVLSWADDRAIVQLDVKRGIDYERVARAVVEADAVDSVLMIAYRIEDAIKALEVDKNLSFSISVNDLNDLTELENAGIPLNQIVAWTGVVDTEQPSIEKPIWAQLEERNIPTAAGAFWDLETQIIESGDTQPYIELVNMGVDMIGSDYYQLAYDTLASGQDIQAAIMACRGN